MAAQLRALAAQSFRGRWELVVVNNRCRDRSIQIVEDFRSSLPAVKIIDASRKVGLNYARNIGAEAAAGDLLDFCDADDVADPGWLEALWHGAASGDILAGPLDLDTLNAGRRAREMSPWDAAHGLEAKHEFLPYAPGGNCAVWADVARTVRWDESFSFGNSDIEFSWRAQLAGWRLAYIPEAVMRVRLKGDVWRVAHQYFRYGRSDPLLYRRFRLHGMPSPGSTMPTPSWRGLTSDCSALLESPVRQAGWARDAARKLGRLVGSLEHGVLVV